MSRRKLILHVGPQKTGTTAIQSGLKSNSEILEKSGYVFPEIGYSYGGHHNIVAQLLEMAVFRPELGGLKKLRNFAKKSDKNIILSSEVFGEIQSIAPLVQLKSLFQDEFDINVIGYLRPQTELLQSLYKTEFMARTHANLPWDNSEKAHQLREGSFKPWSLYMMKKRLFLNYNLWTALFEDVFGRDNVSFDIYSGRTENHFKDFLGKSGVENRTIFQAPGKVHVSDHNLNFVILRQRYRSQNPKSAEEKDRLEAKIIRADMIITDFRKKASYTGPCSLYDEALLQKTLQKYERSNRNLAKRMFGRERLFEHSDNEVHFKDHILEYYTEAEQLDLERRLKKMEDRLDTMYAGR